MGQAPALTMGSRATGRGYRIRAFLPSVKVSNENKHIWEMSPGVLCPFHYAHLGRGDAY